MGELDEACFELAKSLRFQREDDEIEALARALGRIARRQAELITTLVPERSDSMESEFPIVIRAIHYIRQAHAIPPIGGDVRWFEDTLRALLEVACPNAIPNDKGKEFLLDMERGIQSLMEEKT